MMMIINDALFNQAFSYAPIGMAIVSIDGQWLKVNKALLTITGYTEVEMLSTSFQELTFPEDLETDLIHIGEVLAGIKDSYEMEKRYIHKDGSLVWLQLSTSIVREGEKSLYFIAQIQDITHRKQLEQKLIDSEESFRELLTFSPAPILVHNGETVMYANEAAADLLGTTVEKMIESTLAEYINPTNLEKAISIIQDIFATNRPYLDFDLEIQTKDGEPKDAILSAVPIVYKGKKAIQVSYRDITERKKMEQSLKESEEKLRTLIENASDAIFIFPLTTDGLPGEYLEVNQRACHLLGYSKDELLQLTPMDLTPSDRVEKIPFLIQKIQQQGNITFEGAYISKNGHSIPFEFSASMLYLSGEKVILSIGRDITERKKSEELLEQMAYYDSLTQLPNRRLFEERLYDAVTEASINETLIAVMFLDLDGFKQINDTYGHDIGDVMLKEVAERLSSCVRKGDTIARLAGDEFTVMLCHTTEEEAVSVAQRLLDILVAPVSIEEHLVSVTPSIGIAFYPKDGMDAKTLLKHADIAMYKAKDEGKNTYQLYK
jgi:diguanylate cyclase (GGDEF)-like protein/PAS domain S-box-containing protein